MDCRQMGAVIGLLAAVSLAGGCGTGEGVWVGKPSLDWGPASNSLYSQDQVTLEDLCTRLVDECGLDDDVYYECLDNWGFGVDVCTVEANALYACIDLVFDCASVFSEQWWEIVEGVCEDEIEALYTCLYSTQDY